MLGPLFVTSIIVSAWCYLFSLINIARGNDRWAQICGYVCLGSGAFSSLLLLHWVWS